MNKKRFVNQKTEGLKETVFRMAPWYIEKMGDDDFSLEKLTDKNKCKECGGRCCKNYPCSFAPTDFASLKEDTLRVVLDTGLVTIAKSFLSFLNNDYFLLLRPMGEKDIGKVVVMDRFPNTPSVCLLNTSDKGCLLSDSYRPAGGLSLIPGDGRCFNVYNSSWLKHQWLPYQKVLEKLAKEYRNTVADHTTNVTGSDIVKLELALRGIKVH